MQRSWNRRSGSYKGYNWLGTILPLEVEVISPNLTSPQLGEKTYKEKKRK